MPVINTVSEGLSSSGDPYWGPTSENEYAYGILGAVIGQMKSYIHHIYKAFLQYEYAYGILGVPIWQRKTCKHHIYKVLQNLKGCLLL